MMMSVNEASEVSREKGEGCVNSATADNTVSTLRKLSKTLRNYSVSSDWMALEILLQSSEIAIDKTTNEMHPNIHSDHCIK